MRSRIRSRSNSAIEPSTFNRIRPVGEDVSIEIERGGRKIIQELLVSDLHDSSPDEFLEFGDAIVNDLSYQQARHYNRPVSGA